MASLDKLTARVSEHLDPGETILASVLGTYERKSATGSVHSGALFATDRRLVFYAKRVGGHDLESFPYAHLASFESGKSLMGPHVKFVSSGNEVEVKWITGDVAPLLAAVKEHMHAASQPAAAAPLPAQEIDHAAALQKAKELLDSGLISPEEYDAKRAEILARL